MTRSFSNTLLFESAFDTIQNTNPTLYNTALQVFNPGLTVVAEDCATYLGHNVPISFRVEGYTELATDLALNNTRLNTLILAGNTTVNIRNTETCIAVGSSGALVGMHGVCRKCLASSFPKITPPAVGQGFILKPEIVVDQSHLNIATGQTTLALSYDLTQVDDVYLFEDGILVNSAAYTINGTVLTFSVPSPSDTVVVVRYIVKSNAPYYHWLASTFSGSLLGIKPLYETMLPVRKSTFASVIPYPEIDGLVDLLKKSIIGKEDMVIYIDNIKDTVEKSIYVLLLGSIFLQ